MARTQGIEPHTAGFGVPLASLGTLARLVVAAGADLLLVLLTTSAISRRSDAGHPSTGLRISLRIHHSLILCRITSM